MSGNKAPGWQIEYRIIWSDDGYGQSCAGNWVPLQWTFDHQREAGRTDGLGAIDVEQALRVEFREV